MKHLLILLTTIFHYTSSSGQSIVRKENETAEVFANRIRPDSSELAHTVFETKSLDNTKNIIIAFYKKTIDEVKRMPTYVDHDRYNLIIGYLYVPISSNNYKKVLIDTISPDGGDPEIISVFFVNADKDTQKELAVLCKYPQVHYDYGGDFYETFIYDYPAHYSNRLNYFNKLSEKFWGCECTWREEIKRKPEKAKFKTAKDIKTGLLKSGFRQ